MTTRRNRLAVMTLVLLVCLVSFARNHELSRSEAAAMPQGEVPPPVKLDAVLGDEDRWLRFENGRLLGIVKALPGVDPAAVSKYLEEEPEEVHKQIDSRARFILFYLEKLKR
jgi:hypothetical protein